MGKNKKQSYEELENSAQGLLRRLNSQYDEGRVEAEKNAMKTLDSMVEPEESAPDVVTFPSPEPAEKATVPADDGKITDDELQSLFAKYLGSDEDEKEPASYDLLHQQILDAEEKSGVSVPAEEPDVSKNIDEAEKYVFELVQTGETERIQTGEYPRASVDTAEEIAAYEPATLKDAEPDQLPDRIYHMNGEATAEAEVPQMDTGAITDTAMMRAFGLDPHKDPAKDAKIFDEYSLFSTSDIQSTDEITLRELDEDAIPPKFTDAAPSNEFEYTDPEQNKAIFSIFKKKYVRSKLRMVGTGLVAVLLCLIENVANIREMLGGKLNFIAVDWLLAFVAVMIVIDRVFEAVKLLGKFRFDADSVTFFACMISVAATATVVFTTRSYENIFLYNFPLAFCAFLSALNTFISLRRDVYSFKIASSGKVKRAIDREDLAASLSAPESEAFSDMIGASSEMCEVKKTDFVSDFFARRKEYAKAKSALKVLIPACFLVTVGFFFLAYFVAEETLAESFGTAYATFMMCSPFALFLSYSYPMYLASSRAYGYNSAILGDNAPEDYSNASVITFRDEDAFPNGKVKVKSIKIYSDRNIENIIYYASSVYSKIGGPLATVFKQATLNSINSENVELREISAEGVSAIVDGRSIVIGSPAYMENQCFETMPDADDGNYVEKSNNRILYLACDQSVIAKFYIQYNTTSDFVYIVRHLAEMGVCVSIRTNDPGLDSGVLAPNKMDPLQYPVKVVKGDVREEESKAESVSALHASIVSTGSTKEMIKTLLLCDRLRNVRKTNLVLKIVAASLGVAVMALVLFTGRAAEMGSVFPVIYQAFWLLPLLCVSKIYI